MIYFDNAATTRKKPQEVLDAFTYYLTEVGTSPGRGSYSLGIQASRMLYQSRKAVCGFWLPVRCKCGIYKEFYGGN